MTGSDRRIGRRVREQRERVGLSLDELAARCGVSRSMISRIERVESSPTAALLAKLCASLRMTLSGLMADAERPAHAVARRAQQRSWRDPQTGYVRRMVSPSATGSAVEIVEVTLPAAARVAFDPQLLVPFGQHIVMLAGNLTLTVGDETFELQTGDCAHMTLERGAAFENRTRRAARYAAGLPLPVVTGTNPSSSASSNMRERVRKRTPSPFSSENIPPRPGTTSMISLVCFQ